MLIQGFTFIVLGYKFCYSSRRTLKLAQEQEVAENWRQGPETRQSSTCCRDWNKGARKRREKGRTSHAAQTVIERQATSEWKNTCERGAETPEERETRNGS